MTSIEFKDLIRFDKAGAWEELRTWIVKQGYKKLWFMKEEYTLMLGKNKASWEAIELIINRLKITTSFCVNLVLICVKIANIYID